jgi:predicted acyltransferase
VKWTSFFVPFGKNPLFVYIVSEILIVIFFIIPVHDTSFADWSGQGILSLVPGAWGSLLFALIYMMICWGVGFFLDKKKIYIRV